jgi:cyclopropane fatty-acyl-phospholipid synthase-like methyltransferase
MQSQWFETFFQGLAVEFWNRIVPQAATLADVAFLQSALRLAPDARVLDVPCGNGRHSIELARRGCRVTGVDISQEFLAAARRAAAAAGMDFDGRIGDMRMLDSAALRAGGAFDGAFCFGNSFGYLDREGVVAFLDGVSACLKPDGRFAVETGCAAESLLPAFTKSRWMRAGDIVMLSEARYAAEESRLDVDYTFLQGSRVEARPASSHVFTVRELKHLFGQAGFRVTALHASATGEAFTLGGPRLILLAAKERG